MISATGYNAAAGEIPIFAVNREGDENGKPVAVSGDRLTVELPPASWNLIRIKL